MQGKRLLLLGGTVASCDLVNIARSMGVYTIVVDDRPTGPAKELADESAQISTADIEALASFAIEKKVDGVFCTANEFNLKNTRLLCERIGLPFYATEQQWNRCNNKQTVKQYCLRNNLPSIPEFQFSDVSDLKSCPSDMFPVIIKPVDGAGSRGVSICHNSNELEKAVASAFPYSPSGNVVVEKYIDNGGRLFSFRYFLDGDNSYPYMLMDTYIADPKNKKKLISAFSYAPSEYADHFMKTADANVRAMLRDMGLTNGTVFAQSLPYEGKYYCHDMGLRLSGGMTFHMCEHLTGINDMKMMIRLALGGPICTEEELKIINPTPTHGVVGQLMIPLDAGTIASIRGVDAIRKDPAVISYLQYYHEGDTVSETAQGTLMQQFARISIGAPDKDTLVDIVNRLQNNIAITSTEGKEMYTMRFDTNRMYQKM